MTLALRCVQINFYVLALLVTSIFPASVVWATPADGCRLTVGWEDWYPYIYLSNGRLAGSEYSLLIRLQQITGCRLEFLEVPWARALIKLKRKTIDMVYGASLTGERKRYAVFSKPYRYEQFVLVSRDTTALPTVDLAEWLKTDSIKSYRIIGGIQDFHYGDILEAMFERLGLTSNIVRVRKDDQLLGMLMLERIEGFIVEYTIARTMKNGQEGLQISNISGLEPEPMHLMFSLEVPGTVVDRFNNAIEALNKE